MIKSRYGGNEVWSPRLTDSKVEFCSAPYSYRYQTLTPGTHLCIDDLGSFTVFIYEIGAGARIISDDISVELTKHGAFQVEGRTLSLRVEGGEAKILISGVREKHFPAALTFTPLENLKKVVKPWGHELWINGQHPGYALKQIFIRAGFKTSLQYHHFKSETNVLMSGKAKLHYSRSHVEPDQVLPTDIDSVELTAPSIVGVMPPTIHRVEAVTDILLYETSTPHLDDVVRIADDTSRPDGRIEGEHVPQRS